MKAIKTILVFVIVAVGAAIAYAYSGLYDVSVGTGHNPVTEWYLETVRERSIESRMPSDVPADLDSEARVKAGAGHYKDTCAGCHGRPGKEPSDKFDPRPPALYRHAEEPAEAFWVVKHGIKMTAMPHHRDHSDEDIWNIVAFLQALPDMDVAAYEAITADAEHTHADGEDHSHDGASADRADEDGGHAHDTLDTAAATLDAFHHALKEGNGDAALALLHDNATILEGGHLQTKSDYAAGHLASDMQFLAAVETERLSKDADVGDGQATVVTRTRMSGSYNDKAVEVISKEIATLVATEDGWRISHLNWSTEPASAAAEEEGQE